MYDSLTIHTGTHTIQDRITSPGEPGTSHDGTKQGALAYAFWSLGYGDQWGEQNLIYESALTYSAVWACVRVISEALSGIGWHAFERRPDNPRFRFPVEDDTAWLLGLQANPETSAFDWRQVMLMHALTWGNGYAEIERTNSGRPLWLWQIHPSRVEVVRDKDSGQLWYEIDNEVGTSKTRLRPENVFHLKGIGPDGLVGWSIIEMARKSIKLGLQEEKFGSDFFGRGVMPGGVLNIPQRLETEQRKELRRDFESLYAGSRNQHRVVVLSGGQTFTPASLPNNDAQFLESRTFQVQEICRWYGVPPHKLADLVRATFCLPAGSLVSTPAGPKAIETIREGDLVWSLGPNRQMVVSRVTKAGCTGEDEILTIRTRNRTLRCNARHRVMVRRECLVPWAGGRGSYVTFDGVKCRKSWREEWAEAGSLREGDALVNVVALPDLGGDQAPTRTATVEFMESLGLLTGDGFFTRCHRTRRGSGFGISHGENDAYLPHYIGAIENEFRQYDGPYGRKNGGTCALKAKRRDKNATVFYSSLAYDELDACGIVGTAKTKHVPEWIFGLREDLRLAYLRGYLDSDGTVTRQHGQIRFVSVNKSLLEQVRYLCISCGIKVANVYQSNIKSQFDGYGKYEHVLYSFICTDAADNLRIGSHTPFYMERLSARLRVRRRASLDQMLPYRRHEQAIGQALRPSQIVSITRSSPEPVFDLTVSGTHSFVADGLIVHNSNIEEQERAFVTDCLLPWARRLESEADIKLFGAKQRGRRFTRLNLDALMRGNSMTQTETVTQKVQSGLMTPDEGREYFDLNPYQDGIGNTPIVQGAMMPLERVLEEPEPAPAPKLAQPEPAEPAAIRRVFGGLLADAYSRLLRVDIDKAKRAANKGKLAQHVTDWYATPAATDRVKGALMDAFGALGFALHWPEGSAERAALAASERHVEKCRRYLTERGAASIDDWASWPSEASELDLKGVIS